MPIFNDSLFCVKSRLKKTNDHSKIQRRRTTTDVAGVNYSPWQKNFAVDNKDYRPYWPRPLPQPRPRLPPLAPRILLRDRPWPLRSWSSGLAPSACSWAIGCSEACLAASSWHRLKVRSRGFLAVLMGRLGPVAWADVGNIIMWVREVGTNRWWLWVPGSTYSES